MLWNTTCSSLFCCANFFIQWATNLMNTGMTGQGITTTHHEIQFCYVQAKYTKINGGI